MIRRSIARSANVRQSTVHAYAERFRAAGLNWPLPPEMSEVDLERRLFPEESGVSRPGAKTRPDFAHIHQELQRHKHTTLQLLWEEYRAGHADGYGYSRFCHYYQRWRQERDLCCASNIGQARSCLSIGRERPCPFTVQQPAKHAPRSCSWRCWEPASGGLVASSHTNDYAQELPIGALPDGLKKHLIAITFTKPPDFGPTGY
jgi:hypothetical protein